MIYPALPRAEGEQAMIDRLVEAHKDGWHMEFRNKQCPECEKENDCNRTQ